MKQIKIRGNNHYFEDINPNKKEIILLVHGHPFDHTMWRYQLDSLQNFRLLLPDLRGYGKSDYAFEKIFIEEHAFDLALLLDNLNIDKVHLIGLSMGGQIIIEFIRLFPHRVCSLILCSGSPSGETESSYKKRLQLVDRILLIGMKEYTKQDITKYLHLSTIKSNREVYDHLYTMMVNTKIEGAIASHKGRAERRDNYNYLRQIKVPTLIISGEQDFFTPAEEMKEIADQIPHSKFEILLNTGHMTNMEQPKAFNNLLINFYNFLN